MKFLCSLSSLCIEEGFKQKASKVQISESATFLSVKGNYFQGESGKAYSQYDAFRSFSCFFFLIIIINQVSLERVQRSCHSLCENGLCKACSWIIDLNSHGEPWDSLFHLLTTFNAMSFPWLSCSDVCFNAAFRSSETCYPCETVKLRLHKTHAVMHRT